MQEHITKKNKKLIKNVKLFPNSNHYNLLGLVGPRRIKMKILHISFPVLEASVDAL